MTDGKWPNPELPGVPLFPEKDGLHILQPQPTVLIDEPPEIAFWKAEDKGWLEDGIIFYPAQIAESPILYLGSVLTPSQITEMLAAERERCAIICDELSDDFLPTHPSNYAHTIRNLGDAP